MVLSHTIFHTVLRQLLIFEKRTLHIKFRNEHSAIFMLDLSSRPSKFIFTFIFSFKNESFNCVQLAYVADVNNQQWIFNSSCRLLYALDRRKWLIKNRSESFNCLYFSKTSSLDYKRNGITYTEIPRRKWNAKMNMDDKWDFYVRYFYINLLFISKFISKSIYVYIIFIKLN